MLDGTLTDPYTATTIAFVRGAATSSDVQVDHVVALSDAWHKGAQGWDETTRQAFANDPLNLLAVDGPTNAAKGDGDAATWLPPSTAFRCDYVARQVSVKARYGLWVTETERAAIARVLGGCEGEPVTSDAVAQGDRVARQAAQVTIDREAAGELAAGVGRAADEAQVSEEQAAADAAAAEESRPAVPPETETEQAPAVAGPFANCAAARAAGAAPVYRGDLGYSSKLDGDDDGVGCES